MIMYQRKYLPHPLPQQEQPYQWTGSLLSLWLSKQTVQRYQWPYPNLHHHHVILLQKKGKFTQLHCLSLGQHLVDVCIIILVLVDYTYQLFFNPSFTVYVQRKFFSNIMSLLHHFLKLLNLRYLKLLMLPWLIWEKEGQITNIFQTFYIDGILKSYFIHIL